MNWLKISRRTGILGNEEAPSYHSKYYIRQKLEYAILISKSPEEYFQPFVETSKLENRIWTLSQQFLAELSKLHSNCPEERFGRKKLKKYNFINFFEFE